MRKLVFLILMSPGILSEYAFALSSPIRVDILRLMKDKDKISNKALAVELGIHPSNMSQHLKVLKNLRLIKETDRLKDNTVLIKLVPSTISKLQEGLSFLFE